MLRDLLSRRLIQGGLVFFMLVVGGSLLYSWHIQRTTETELGKKPLAVVSRENKPSTNTAPVDFQTEGVTNTSDENTDTQMPDTTDALPNETENLDLADAFLPDDFVSEEEAPAEDVPVSPYGFGPYPEVPADYPFTPFWFRYKEDPERYDAKYDTEMLKSKELLSRVMVKAWTEGLRDFTGGSGSLTTGKYYLHFPNAIYVEYGEPYENEDGTFTTPISSYTGGNVHLTHEQMQKGEVPSGVRVIEGDGYDPYEYLDLP
ncbi:hypothetical protein C6503_26400 [Candidatus Poribacteria bacterium]|nr:MAG: hypothetical protein C6503_26400 [Candidatus Poribacteria bacterium]